MPNLHPLKEGPRGRGGSSGAVKRMGAEASRVARGFGARLGHAAERLGVTLRVLSARFRRSVRSRSPHNSKISSDGPAGATNPATHGAPSLGNRADLEEYPRFLSRSARSRFDWVAQTEGDRRSLYPPGWRGGWRDADAGTRFAVVLSAIAAIAITASFSIWLGNFGRSGSAIARIPAEGYHVPPRVQLSGGDCEAQICTGGIPPVGHGEPRLEQRLSYAPRFTSMFGSASLSVMADAERARTAAAEAAAADAAAVAAASRIYRVRIRDLPPGSRLSAGEKISPTEWLLAEKDLNNLVVTLPGGRNVVARAEISLVGKNGVALNTFAVAIERPDAVERPPPREVRKPKVRRKPPPAAKPMALPKTPVKIQPLMTSSPPPVPPAPPSAPPAPAFSIFPWLSGASIGKTAGTTAGTDTMINLGVLPRESGRGAALGGPSSGASSSGTPSSGPPSSGPPSSGNVVDKPGFAEPDGG